MFTYTVIIPHYTRFGDVKLLNRAVDSIPNRFDIQILVIDNSPVQIDQNLFNGRGNIKILYSDNARGAGGARNEGIQYAQGEWMLFLDADDFFEKDAFLAFDKYIDSAFDIIFFKMTSCYSDTYEKAERGDAYTEMVERYLRTKDEYELRYRFPSPCAKMIRTSFIKEFGIFYDEVKVANDVMFALRIGLKAGKISADKSAVYCATIERGSLTNTHCLENIKARFDVNIRKNQVLKENGMKKTESVMYYIVSSLRFGLIPFLELFFVALQTGNLFVGSRNWLHTVCRRLFARNKKDRQYVVTYK